MLCPGKDKAGIDRGATSAMMPFAITVTNSPTRFRRLVRLGAFPALLCTAAVYSFANAYGIPFVYVADSNVVDVIMSQTNREVVLRAFNGTAVKVIDVETTAQELKDEILALKTVLPLEIDPIASFGSYSTNTTALFPSDIVYFGGKAANYGFLRRTIPAYCRDAIAFSFDLWTDYLDQDIGGETLREAISNRLATYTYPPADFQALDADLDYIRDLQGDTMGLSEGVGLFANHRRKSAWQFEVNERWLDETGRVSSSNRGSKKVSRQPFSRNWMPPM